MPNADASIRRQLQQRLESLSSAGVEYLPRVESSRPAPTADAAPGPTPAADGGSLFSTRADSAGDAPEQRRIELNLLAVRVSKCRQCSELVSTRSQTVFGVGPIDPEICFIGEAPGADEDRQ